MRREMVWVERERFRGWACSECTWKCNPSSVPGRQLDRGNEAELRLGSATGSLHHICAMRTEGRTSPRSAAFSPATPAGRRSGQSSQEAPDDRENARRTDVNEEAKQRGTVKGFHKLASLQHLTPRANSVRTGRE